MAYFRRSTCRLCDSEKLDLALSLAATPPANAFLSEAQLDTVEARYPLDVFMCRDCAHIQLLDVVDSSELFENYVYVSGTSPAFVKHFEDYAGSTVRRFSLSPGDLAVDIGSNDGTLLSEYKALGLEVQGIDPARDIAETASQAGIDTLVGFFSKETADFIREKRGRAAIITANNVFAHIDDLSGVVGGLRRLLQPNGVFCFEVSYFVDVFEKTLFDTIYHEHLDYHTVGPLQAFFAGNGMELIAIDRISTHGGSIRGIAQLTGGSNAVDESVGRLIDLEKKIGLNRLETLRGFDDKIRALGDKLGALLRQLRADGKSIAGFGAPAKTTTLTHQFALDPEIIDFIVDDSPLKQGLYTPGFHIPVLPTTALYQRQPDYTLILAWNFADQIINNHQAYIEAGGHFIIPLPDLKVVPS